MSELDLEAILEENIEDDGDTLADPIGYDKPNNMRIQDLIPRKDKRLRKRAKILFRIRYMINHGFTPKQMVEDLEPIEDYKQLRRWLYMGRDEKLYTQEQVEATLAWESINDKSVKEYHRVHKLMFQQIPCIADFKEAKIKIVRVWSYMKHIQTVCDVIEKYPYQLLDSENSLTLLADALSVFNKKTGKPLSDYIASWRTFFQHHGITIPKGFRSGALQVTPPNKYPDVELTDKQFEEGLYWLDEHHPEYLKFFAVQHEIFARSSAISQWTVNYELKQMEVDGELCEYLEIPRFYEAKTGDYWTKRVFDHRVIHILQNIEKNTDFFPKIKYFKVYKTKYHNALREMYREIGILPKNATSIDQLKRGTKEYYIFREPAYVLRHSGARMWVRRANYNANLIATMGWNDVGILTKHYASTSDAEFFSQRVCEVCNPRKHKFDNMEFCSTSHALLHYQREKIAS